MSSFYKSSITALFASASNNSSSFQLIHDGTHHRLYRTTYILEKQHELEDKNKTQNTANSDHHLKKSVTDVVIKVNTENQNSNLKQKLFSEYQMGKLLRHCENVVQLFAFEPLEDILSFISNKTTTTYPNTTTVDNNSTMAIVMEDLSPATDWQNLASFLQQKSEVDLQAQLCIAIEIAKGLICLHRKGVIHRCISPTNIMVKFDGSWHIKYIDFSNSSLMKQETQVMNYYDNENLYFMSPEQTGKTNRIVDYRTDVYSVGLVLYNLFSKRIPYSEYKSFSQIVKAHTSSISLDLHSTQIPTPIIHIISKCIKKLPEKRYQSAYGFFYDLTKCLEFLMQTKDKLLSKFELKIASQDTFERFQLTSNLYGREQELNNLKNIFDKAMNDVASQMALVFGYSGTGKTSVVMEFGKAIVADGGFFVSGKSDQYKQVEPYFSIIGALKSICQQILAEPESVVMSWKQKILNQVGNISLLVDVVPEIEQIVGQVEKLTFLDSSATETQNRFNYTLVNFLSVFCQQDHPLIIFLDDLQWSDASTLTVLKLLVEKLQYFFFIGSYRDNEVSDDHILLKTIEDIKKGKEVTSINLEPLKQEHVLRLIMDSLRISEEEAVHFSEIVYNTTRGNPFFINMYLTTLHNEGLVYFDFDERKWRWKLDLIRQREVPATIVTLMSTNIKKFPSDVQHILSTASILGNIFDLKVLALICSRSEYEIYELLSQTIHFGLIISIENAKDDKKSLFKFVHDRVQQAAASILNENQKRQLNLSIGNLLLNYYNAEELEENLFYVVDQLNNAKMLMIGETERLQLVLLNQRAVKKASDSSAFAAAYIYATEAQSLMKEEYWQSNYKLIFEVSCMYLECAALNAEYEKFEKLHPIVSNNAVAEDKTKVNMLLALNYELQQKYQDTVKVLNAELARFGIILSLDPEKARDMFIREFESISNNLRGRNIIDLPNDEFITDPKKLLILDILKRMSNPSYMGFGPNVFSLVVSVMVNYSLNNGIAFDTANSFISLCICACCHGGELIPMAGDFAKAGLKITEKLTNKSTVCTCYNAFGAVPCPWVTDINDSDYYLSTSFKLGIESGNFSDASYAAFQRACYNFIGLPANINEVLNNLEVFLNFMKKNNAGFYEFTMSLINAYIDLAKPTGFDVESYGQKYKAGPFFYCGYYYYKVLHAYFFDDIESVESILETSSGFLSAVLLGLFESNEFYFYVGLCYLNLAKSNKSYLEKAKEVESKHRFWNSKCSLNMEYKLLLLQAEIARLEGNDDEALEKYQEAIDSCKRHNRLLHQALCEKHFALFWMDIDCPMYAQVQFENALTLYQSLGATVQINHLVKKYSYLVSAECLQKLQVGQIDPQQQAEEQGSFDIYTVVKASQVLSKEVDISQFLQNIMKIVFENTGGTRAVLLIQVTDQPLKVKAVVTASSIKILQNTTVEQFHLLPASVISLVTRTQSPVLFGNAQHELAQYRDKYVTDSDVKSIICIAPIKRPKISAFIYVEHDSLFNCFASDKIEMLNILCTQIIISLENRAFFDEQILVTKQALEEKIKAQETEDYRANLEKFIDAICHEIRNPLNGIRANATFFLDSIEKLNENSNFPQAFSGITNQVMEFLETIMRCVLYQKVVIEDVLNLSRLESNKMKLLSKIFNIKELIQSCFDNTSSIFDCQSTCNLNVIDAHSTVSGDEDRLRSVITTVLTVLIKRMEKPLVEVNLEVIERKNTTIRFGISVIYKNLILNQSEIDRLFNRFTQLVVQDYGELSGLGLLISKKLVELMNGDIEVVSSEENGTVFNIIVELGKSAPLKRQVSEDVTVYPVSQATNQKEERFVLVVEDNSISQKVIERYLQISGCKVVSALNGLEAVKEASTQKFACIFMDIGLPILSGLDATKRIREFDKRTPIIGLSGSSARETIEEALQWGMNDFICKPFDRQQILSVISKWTRL